jgi:pyruvate/2-oxoglutarate dehydrogenase complex dihydrolipoamide dehydrogenase (E3) component
VIPQVVFTTPEVGLVGISYGEAPAHGVHAAVARHDARGSGQSVTGGEEAGYFKLVFDQDTQRLVGAQMVSPAAEELIQFCALAIRSRVPAAAVEAQVSIYPSRGDQLIRAFGPTPDALFPAVEGPAA